MWALPLSPQFSWMSPRGTQTSAVSLVHAALRTLRVLWPLEGWGWGHTGHRTCGLRQVAPQEASGREPEGRPSAGAPLPPLQMAMEQGGMHPERLWQGLEAAAGPSCQTQGEGLTFTTDQKELQCLLPLWAPTPPEPRGQMGPREAFPGGQ